VVLNPKQQHNIIALLGSAGIQNGCGWKRQV